MGMTIDAVTKALKAKEMREDEAQEAGVIEQKEAQRERRRSRDSSAEDDRVRRNEKHERRERKWWREEHRYLAGEAAELFKDVDRDLLSESNSGETTVAGLCLQRSERRAEGATPGCSARSLSARASSHPVAPSSGGKAHSQSVPNSALC
jgi:hypothetical protein